MSYARDVILFTRSINRSWIFRIQGIREVVNGIVLKDDVCSQCRRIKCSGYLDCSYEI